MSKERDNILITSATRTAVGSIGRSLKNIPAEDMGSEVIRDSIKKSKIKNSDINEIIMGQVLTGAAGQNPARQAAIKCGIPKETPAFIVNQVCGSSGKKPNLIGREPVAMIQCLNW